MDRAVIMGALSAYTQAGRVMYDLNRDVYRVRELSREPLPFEQLRFSNEREKQARSFINEKKVKSTLTLVENNHKKMTGRVTDQTKNHDTELLINADQRLVEASCTCRFFQKNKLFQGPCEHILATRIHASQQ